MEEKLGKLPLGELRKLFEGTGFEVISINPEREGLIFSGVIKIEIAPENYLKQSDFFIFPQVQRNEDYGYIPQSFQQEKGSCQE
jgi:hypothetical protein